MLTSSKLLLATMTATVCLSLAVSTASARRLFISFPRYQTIATLLVIEITGTATIQCPVTLEGSFHSQSISKVSGELVGYVTSAKIRGGRAECLNTGTARFNTETLPWHRRFRDFAGNLPDIALVDISDIGISWNVDPEGATPNCRVTTTAAKPLGEKLRPSGPGLNLILNTSQNDETTKIPIGGEFFCELAAAESNLRGTSELFAQGSTTTRILLRLIQ